MYGPTGEGQEARNTNANNANIAIKRQLKDLALFASLAYFADKQHVQYLCVSALICGLI